MVDMGLDQPLAMSHRLPMTRHILGAHDDTKIDLVSVFSARISSPKPD